VMNNNWKKFVVSYSCGKDSTLALNRVLNEGFVPCAILVTINKKTKKSWSHEMPRNILDQVSKSLQIPLIISECEGNDYADAFEKALSNSKSMGAEACVFGDIDIEEHRNWCTERCNNVGLEAVFPLWKGDREQIAMEFIEAGFKAVIKTVDLNRVGESILGRPFTKEIIEEIKRFGADPCGENGEYHTFVFDGPIFKFPIQFSTKGTLKKDHYEGIIIEMA